MDESNKKRKPGRPIDIHSCHRQKLEEQKRKREKVNNDMKEEKDYCLLLFTSSCLEEQEEIGNQMESIENKFKEIVEKEFSREKICYGIVQNKKWNVNEFQNIYMFVKEERVQMGIKLKKRICKKDVLFKTKKKMSSLFNHRDLASGWVSFFCDSEEDLFIDCLVERSKEHEPFIIGISKKEISENLEKVNQKRKMQERWYLMSKVPREFIPSKMWDRIPVYTKMLYNFFIHHKVLWRMNCKDEKEFRIGEDVVSIIGLLDKMYSFVDMKKHIMEGSRVFESILKHKHFDIIFQKFKSESIFLTHPINNLLFK